MIVNLRERFTQTYGATYRVPGRYKLISCILLQSTRGIKRDSKHASISRTNRVFIFIDGCHSACVRTRHDFIFIVSTAARILRTIITSRLSSFAIESFLYFLENVGRVKELS